ncbi:3TM-type holin [Salinicola halophilus]|uniref:3TM-type holin n=1 Tax=Salinicola halophilus TaxID=184065 RepID=UPI000DA14D09|nr:3TM-type holin [Salinicola halophilus]
MIDWKSAAAEVAKVAPSVASAIGGPAVGGVTTGAVTMLANMLGIDEDPASFVAATKDPEQRAELVRINNEHRRELESMRLQAEQASAAEETKRLTEINTTMRAELGTEGWFKSGWRPATGWVFMLSLGALVAALIYCIVRNPALLANPETVGLLCWVIGTMGAALGINVRERTKGKQIKAGQKPTSLYNAIRARTND